MFIENTRKKFTQKLKETMIQVKRNYFHEYFMEIITVAPRMQTPPIPVFLPRDASKNPF